MNYFLRNIRYVSILGLIGLASSLLIVKPTLAGGYVSVTQNSISNSGVGTRGYGTSVYWQNTDSSPVTLVSDDNWSVTIQPGQSDSKTYSAQSFSSNKTINYYVQGSSSVKSFITVFAPLVQTSGTSNTISLSWGSASGDSSYPITSYEIRRGGQKIGETQGNSFTETGLSPSTHYSYYVNAMSNGTIEYQTPSTDTSTSANTPPSTPGNLTAKILGNTTDKGGQVSGSTVQLNWTSSSSAAGINGYSVYMNGSQANVAYDTTYTFYNVPFGETQIYSVRARDSYNQLSNESNKVLVTPTKAVDPTPIPSAPSTPGNLTAKILGNTIDKKGQVSGATVQLSWSPSTVGAGLNGYPIFMNRSQASIAYATTYTFYNVTFGQMVVYSVKARDTAGQVSGQSNEVILTPTRSDTASLPATQAPISSSGSAILLTPLSSNIDNTSGAAVGTSMQDLAVQKDTILLNNEKINSKQIINLDKDTITVSGKSLPNITVILKLHSKEVDFTTTADGNGNWSKQLALASLENGSHTITALYQKDGVNGNEEQVASFTYKKPFDSMTLALGTLIGLVVAGFGVSMWKFFKHRNNVLNRSATV